MAQMLQKTNNAKAQSKEKASNKANSNVVVSLKQARSERLDRQATDALMRQASKLGW